MVCFHNHLNRLLLLSSVLLLGWARPVVLFLCSLVSLDTRVRSVLFPGLYPSLRQGGRSRAGRQGQCGEQAPKVSVSYHRAVPSGCQEVGSPTVAVMDSSVLRYRTLGFRRNT